ncbi:MAG: hypothetical protein L6R41_004981 [Letrouitia leprolyta]|nr:MAG: hypothetical protein L6R41_004981 [Letrouitia leprolyta]
MDRFASKALRYQSICTQCRRKLFPSRTSLRQLSTSTRNFAESPDPPRQPPIDIPEIESSTMTPTQQSTDQTTSPSASVSPSTPDRKSESGRSSITSDLLQAQGTSNATSNKPSSLGETMSSILSWASNNSPDVASSRSIAEYPPLPEPHHLHIYSTKHNTHITLTNPNRDPLISVSSGSIGFRKAARGTYDAAYQLGAYVMGRIQQQGLLTQIQSLEVVLRDFGPGREAVSKILLGSEGRNLRGRVVRVCDATKLKFGGTRSKNRRRI